MQSFFDKHPEYAPKPYVPAPRIKSKRELRAEQKAKAIAEASDLFGLCNYCGTYNDDVIFGVCPDCSPTPLRPIS